MTVKALYPVWKTWWAKWNDAQRTAFNTLRAEGLSLNEAALRANQTVAAEPDIEWVQLPPGAFFPEPEQVKTTQPAPKAAKTYKPRAKKA